MEEKIQINHKVQFMNRQEGIISGVRDVESFDLNEIILETVMGKLCIKGKDLHVKRLSLDRGEVELRGEVSSFVYHSKDEKKSSKDSFVGRFFS